MLFLVVLRMFPEKFSFGICFAPSESNALRLYFSFYCDHSVFILLIVSCSVDDGLIFVVTRSLAADQRDGFQDGGREQFHGVRREPASGRVGEFGD